MTKKEYLSVTGKLPPRNSLGVCAWSRKDTVIFVDINKRINHHGQYTDDGNTRADYDNINLKEALKLHKDRNGNISSEMGYANFEHTLIHELVHYRFPILEHGEEFDDIVRNIIDRKEYPSSSLWIERMTKGYYNNGKW